MKGNPGWYEKLDRLSQYEATKTLIKSPSEGYCKIVLSFVDLMVNLVSAHQKYLFNNGFGYEPKIDPNTIDWHLLAVSKSGI
ncbi:MAG: hypothetical protein RCG15_00630 [Candidatus Rickettsia vulgarisii]